MFGEIIGAELKKEAPEIARSFGLMVFKKGEKKSRLSASAKWNRDPQHVVEKNAQELVEDQSKHVRLHLYAAMLRNIQMLILIFLSYERSRVCSVAVLFAYLFLWPVKKTVPCVRVCQCPKGAALTSKAAFVSDWRYSEQYARVWSGPRDGTVCIVHV